MLSLKEINRRNKKVWTYRQRLWNEQLANPDIATIAKALYDEHVDKVEDWRDRRTFECFLGEAERRYRRLPSGNSRIDACRRGGLKRRVDLLQRRILFLVRENSFITLGMLRRRLRALPRSGLTFERDSITG